VLGCREIHTGYTTATKNLMALLQSISKRPIRVVYHADGTTTLKKLSECPVSIKNANGCCIMTNHTKNKVGVFPVHGMTNLNHGTDQRSSTSLDCLNLLWADLLLNMLLSPSQGFCTNKTCWQTRSMSSSLKLSLHGALITR
jgi:hypothetical protein